MWTNAPLPPTRPAQKLPTYSLLRLVQSGRQKQVATHPGPARLEVARTDAVHTSTTPSLSNLPQTPGSHRPSAPGTPNLEKMTQCLQSHCRRRVRAQKIAPRQRKVPVSPPAFELCLSLTTCPSTTKSSVPNRRNNSPDPGSLLASPPSATKALPGLYSYIKSKRQRGPEPLTGSFNHQ